MSKYYKPIRTRNLYDPTSDQPFKLSRSKIDLFINCPRCFYLDRRLGMGQPPGYPFNLNSAVDNLLKNEFDHYRKRKEAHPLCIENKLDAIPYSHPDLDMWRDSLRKGITYHDLTTNLIISGGVDDIWINSKEELIIVDYKATSKKEEVSIDADWHIAYKRQMSLYAWLFKMNNFKVCDTGYFVYCNGKADEPFFNKTLSFDISILPYQIDDSWVEQTVKAAYDCLQSSKVPLNGEDCDYCKYVETVKRYYGGGVVKY